MVVGHHCTQRLEWLWDTPVPRGYSGCGTPLYPEVIVVVGHLCIQKSEEQCGCGTPLYPEVRGTEWLRDNPVPRGQRTENKEEAEKEITKLQSFIWLFKKTYRAMRYWAIFQPLTSGRAFRSTNLPALYFYMI